MKLDEDVNYIIILRNIFILKSLLACSTISPAMLNQMFSQQANWLGWFDESLKEEFIHRPIGLYVIQVNWPPDIRTS